MHTQYLPGLSSIGVIVENLQATLYPKFVLKLVRNISKQNIHKIIIKHYHDVRDEIFQCQPILAVTIKRSCHNQHLRKRIYFQ